jgi:hypothetical protein
MAYLDVNGYAVVWFEGRAKPYARFLAEEYLGRSLTTDEVVHHIDEDPLNNSIDNLLVMTRSAHMSLHKKGKPGNRAGLPSGMLGKRHTQEAKDRIGRASSGKQYGEETREIIRGARRSYEERKNKERMLKLWPGLE